MQRICTLLQTDNHTNTSPLNFYRPDALPDTQPTVSKQYKDRNVHYFDYCYYYCDHHYCWYFCVMVIFSGKPRSYGFPRLLLHFFCGLVEEGFHWSSMLAPTSNCQYQSTCREQNTTLHQCPGLFICCSCSVGSTSSMGFFISVL